MYLVLNAPEAGKLQDSLMQSGLGEMRRTGASELNASTGVTQQSAAAVEFEKKSIFGGIAQRLEQPAHNWLVPGSNPGAPTYHPLRTTKAP